MTTWGNHSTTQYPDLTHALVDGSPAWVAVDDEAWIADQFIPTVAKRGAAIIEARGAAPPPPAGPPPPPPPPPTGGGGPPSHRG